MACYIVTFEPDESEAAIVDALRRWRAKRLLRSVWLMEMDSAPELVRRAAKAAAGREIKFAILELAPKFDYAVEGVADPGDGFLVRHGDRRQRT